MGTTPWKAAPAPAV